MKNECEKMLTAFPSVRRCQEDPGKCSDSWTGGGESLRGDPCLFGMLNFYIKKATKN